MRATWNCRWASAQLGCWAGSEGGGVRKPVKSADETGLPLDIALLHGIADGQAFDIDPGAVHFQQLGPRHGCHTEPALVFEHHEPIRHQTRQRLTNGGGPDAIALAKGLNAQALVGPEAGANDVGAQQLYGA